MSSQYKCLEEAIETGQYMCCVCGSALLPKEEYRYFTDGVEVSKDENYIGLKSEGCYVQVWIGWKCQERLERQSKYKEIQVDENEIREDDKDQ